MISITRRYRFSASHRLHSQELNVDENNRVFGKCNNPFGHGHDYILEVGAAGPVNPQTGVILPIQKLDRMIEEQVLQIFAHRNINLDVPQFATLIPTTENVALVITDLLEQNWTRYLGASRARLVRVHVQETERNGFEVLLHTEVEKYAPDLQDESVTVNA